MNKVSSFLAIILASSPLLQPAQTLGSVPDDLRVLSAASNAPAEEGMLRTYLRTATQSAFARRAARYATLTSSDAIVAYQADLKKHFLDSLGGFPIRTPLNARVTGRLERADYVIEKIIFESQPGFHVTGLLYLPRSAAPHQVVLMPCGHSENGKIAYQVPATTLVKNGLAVFCFDPIGQGERAQILRPDAAPATKKSPVLFPATSEHTITGVAPILLGRNLATHMIWDGTRAIDYLATRSDLDLARLGCAGNSGGGMMTAYLMALEPRIQVAAAGCFVTTSLRKNERPGPGDAEQNVHAQYVHGIDHSDFLILHAPRPAIICAATRDYVPIEGAWEAFREAKRIYTRLGFAERVDLIETDATHGFSVQLREGTARWMRRWLLGQDAPVFEQPADVFADHELVCTPRGQVRYLEGARSLMDLNRAEAERLTAERTSGWRVLSDAQRRDAVRRVAGIRSLAESRPPGIEPRGELARTGYRIEKLVITPEPGVQLPAWRFIPGAAPVKRCLYVHGGGKRAALDAIVTLVHGGAEVLAVDLRGHGETAMKPWRVRPAEIAGDNGAEFFVAYMLGRSLVGMRAEDVLSATSVLAAGGQSSLGPVELIAEGDAAIPALHAAAVEPQRFSRVRLTRTIDSWERVIATEVPRRQLENAVHGALRTYDLTDLATLAGHVVMEERVDAAGAPLPR